MSENVIKFPETRAKKVIAKNQSEARQALVAFSMLSFVLIAVYSNEQILRGQRPVYTVSDNGVKTQIRSIASVEADSMRDLEWERKLAEKLQKSEEQNRMPASVGRSPSAVDIFRLQYADKYLIHLSPENSNKILSMSYVDSEAGDNPIHIKHLVEDEQILVKDKALFPVDYSSAKKIETGLGREIYQLLDDTGREVGRAVFEVDDQSRVLALYFRN